jgi:hypothetical protein
LADPQFRHDRAFNAAMARTSPDHYIAKLTEAAASLTDAHRTALRGLLKVARRGGA